MNTYGVVGVVGREYIWRHRRSWGVNTYGLVIGGGGASIHMASYGVVGRQYIWRHRGVVGRQYIWRHSGWWGVNTYGVIGGGGASIHMAS